MAVVAIITLEGEPEGLLKAYDAMDSVTKHIPTDGLLFHTAARREGGLVMVDLWESEEKLGAYMAHPDFEKALSEGNLPEPKVDVFEVDRSQLG